MWRFTPNNGLTERFHNNMELLQPQSYGSRTSRYDCELG